MLEAMIILRLWNGAVDHFPVRRSEWINSLAMIGWGLVILLDNRPLLGTWYALGQIFQEVIWAGIFIAIGSLRLTVVIVNGTFKKSWYGKWSPHFRVAVSLFAALAWFQLVLASVYAPYLNTGIVAYTTFFVQDALNTLSASAEARELDKGKRNVAAGTVDDE